MAKITSEENRIEIGGDYLIIAPRGAENGYGYYHMLTERKFLVENIINFMKNYSVKPHQVTVYELRELNAPNNVCSGQVGTEARESTGE